MCVLPRVGDIDQGTHRLDAKGRVAHREVGGEEATVGADLQETRTEVIHDAVVEVRREEHIVTLRT